MPTIHVFEIHYTPADSDSDGKVYSEGIIECAPNLDDVADGYTTPERVAARTIRDSHYISGPHCASGYPGPWCWFSAEPYENPYQDRREEMSVHRGDGWTDAQWREVWRLVTAA